MIIAKHTISVYNSYTPLFTGGIPPTPKWDKTVIQFAQWEDSSDRNAANDGKNVIERHVSIIIPKTADTQGREYIDWKEYDRLTMDNFNYWTLKHGDTIIAFGDTPEITSLFTITSLINQYKTCKVSGVEDLTNQPIMPHFEVIGV